MTTVDIKPIKNKAMQFPEPLKSLILSESDSMDSDEFIAKLEMWEKIAEMTTPGVYKK